MSRAANRIQKNKFAETNQGKQSMSVGEYIEKKEFRKNLLWSLVEGQWFVTVSGIVLMESDFNRLYPEPVVPHFSHDTTNIDSTRKWMYE